MPSVKRIFAKLAGSKVRDIFHLNIFEVSELPHEDSNVWMWSLTSLRRSKEIGFAI